MPVFKYRHYCFCYCLLVKTNMKFAVALPLLFGKKEPPNPSNVKEKEEILRRRYNENMLSLQKRP